MFALLIRCKIRTLLLLAVAWPAAVQGIVGGEDAKAGEFPHQALLGYRIENTTDYGFWCGGSLISDQYVLTAANCHLRMDVPPELVVLGASVETSSDDNVEEFLIEAFIKHEKYDDSLPYHDIALVKLQQKVETSDFIQPACLWKTSELNFDSVIATGSGLLHYEDEMLSGTLQKVQLDFLNKSECVQEYIPKYNFELGIIDEQLCVGSLVGGKDTCVGDAGGPIQVVSASSNCTHSIVGIISIGVRECGAGHAPGIYTRVPSYIEWIDNIVWPKK